MGKQTISRTTLAKGVTACVVVAASLGIVQIGEYSINSSEEAASTAVSSTTGTVAYTPGTYTATAAGIQSDVTVSCTFDEGSITSITVDVSGETAGLGADIGDEMIESFLAAQSSNVDGVSGATITSDALKAALEECIAQATGGSGNSDSSEEADEEATEGSTSSDEEDTDAAETESATEAETDAAADTEADETEGETEAASDASETETESEADSEVTAAASENTASSSGSGTYTPGTYTATAAGMESDVTVTVTVDETSILSLGIDVSGETDGIGAAIGPEISEQILNAQSADVDGVSGATVTSTAVKTALADALDQAASGSSDTSDDTDSAAAIAEAETEAVETEDVETEAIETETEVIETEASEIETEAIETETEALETEAVETETEALETEVINESSTDENDGGFVPGTYTASAAGISSDVTVTCTFDETGLVSIEADVSGETSGIGADIGDTMIARVLEAQSSDVDGVSGATITSDAFKAAVADCMAQAGFVAEETEAETEADTEEITEEVTEAVTEVITEEVTEAVTEVITEKVTEAVTEEETEATETETDEIGTEAIETETADEPAAIKNDSSFVPGTYTASAAGISSDVTVTCTFDETGLVSIEADVSGETSGIGAEIGDTMIARVLEAQSSEVDGVSGATITSDAFKAAVADCMEQAGFVAEDAETETEAETESEAEAENQVSDDSDTELAAAADAPFVPGTYTATAQGLESKITVNVTFDEYNIVAVGTWLEGETDGIGADIGEEISNQILEAQSADVDGVSGATVTSTAVKEAVADCIAQAKVNSEDNETEETETETITEEITEESTEAITEEMTEAVTEEETEEMTEAVTEEETEEMTETITEAETEEMTEAVTEKGTEEMTEEETEEETETATDGSRFFAGVYTASAAGINSDVTVTIIVDENRILSIGYDVSGETAGIGADIGPEISGQILAAQSADVDGISGATVTSDAFKAALADCIAQAEGSRTAEAEVDDVESEEDAEVEVETDADEEESESEDTATTESAADEETPDSSEEASLTSLYSAGIYSSSAVGISSDIVVTVSFDDDSITAIGYDLSGESADIGALIGAEISGQILTAQSVDVDGVSGATITSEAFKAAVADCIAQAQIGSSDVVIIGGADEPTSIFLAGTADEEETELSETDDAE